MNTINRREAANIIRHQTSLRIYNQDGTSVYLRFIPSEEEDYLGNEYKKGLYRCNSYYDQNGTECWTEYQPITYKDVLFILRSRYARYIGSECEHKYDIWNERGTRVIMQARCTVGQEHFHCRSCQASEVATGIYSCLCRDCHEAAEKERRAITQRMMQYQQRFNIPFKRDEDMVEAYSYEDDGALVRKWREDFHADG